MMIDPKEYDRLMCVEYNYNKLKELITNLFYEMNSLDIILKHDLEEKEAEDIEEI